MGLRALVGPVASEETVTTVVQVELLAFFAVVVSTYDALGRRAWQNALLDFAVGRLLVSRPARRRLWLAVSLTGDLGMLGVFKVADFFL